MPTLNSVQWLPSCKLNNCCSFSYSVLQAQKLIMLEEIAGPEVQAEEDPKGEEIVGSGGEALKPPTQVSLSF